ncbi:MAG: hypothetical protein HY908_02770 [Myxococcales bacterium]|nr:hypothetical protein [Myxococcales bacterium]
MIVQCHACGAPLDVSAPSGSVVCCYCRTKQRVRALTVQQPVTPPNWLPPPAWNSPAGELYYRPTATAEPSGNARQNERLMVIAILVAVVVSGAAAGIYAVVDQTSSDSGRTVAVDAPATNQAPAPVTPEVSAGARATATAAEAVALFMDPRPALAAYAGKLGPQAQLRSLSLYSDFAVAEVATLGGAAAVDRYVVRGAALGTPEPVPLSQHDKSRLAACSFPLAAVDAGAVRNIAEDAKRSHASPAATVSHMTLQSCPFTDTPTWSVFVGDARGTEGLAYDLSGARRGGSGAPSGRPPATAGARPTVAPTGAKTTPAPPATPPPTAPAQRGPCGCAADDVMCVMRCSKKGTK